MIECLELKYQNIIQQKDKEIGEMKVELKKINVKNKAMEKIEEDSTYVNSFMEKITEENIFESPKSK